MDEGLSFSDIFDDDIPYEVKPPEMLRPMEEAELLTETHLQDLFHATHEHQLLGMLEDDAVKLAFVGGTQADEFYNRGYPFFLSTMRQKYGNYARDIGGEYVGNKYNVIVHLDGTALTAAGFKHFPMEYWGSMSSRERSEQEERIVSNTDEIKPLKKFVKGIHVYIPEDLKHEITIDKLHKASDLAKERGVNIYFYPHNALLYFRAQRTDKAVTDVSKLLKPAELSPEDLNLLDLRQRYGKKEAIYLSAFLRIYNGDYSNIENFPDERVLVWLRWYPHDAYGSLMADAHNYKPHHLPIFRDIAAIMKKEGVKNFKDLITIVIEREQERLKKERELEKEREREERLKKSLNEVQEVIPPGEKSIYKRVDFDRADSIFISYDNGLVVGMQETPTKMVYFSNDKAVEKAMNIPDFQKFITTSYHDRQYQLTHTHLSRLIMSGVRRAKAQPPSNIGKTDGTVAGRTWKFENGHSVGFWQTKSIIKQNWKTIQFILDKLKIDWKNAEYTFQDKVLKKYSFDDIMSGKRVKSVSQRDLAVRRLMHLSPQVKHGILTMSPNRLQDYADRINIPVIKLKQMLGSMDEMID